MARSQSQPLTGAQRVYLEDADRPTLEHRPDCYVDGLLAKWPASVLNASSGDLVHVYGVALGLATAEARVGPAGDVLRSEHAAARDALEEYVAELFDETPDSPVEMPHDSGCAVDVEVADHSAQTPYGRCLVRVARCVRCGAQTVVNRLITIPADPTEVARRRRAEAAANGTGTRWPNLKGPGKW